MEALDCGRERTRRKRLLIVRPGVVNNPCSMAFLRHVRNQPGHGEYLVLLLKERHCHAFLMTIDRRGPVDMALSPGAIVLRRFSKRIRLCTTLRRPRHASPS
jgi:hypothetical protein